MLKHFCPFAFSAIQVSALDWWITREFNAQWAECCRRCGEKIPLSHLRIVIDATLDGDREVLPVATPALASLVETYAIDSGVSVKCFLNWPARF